MSTEVTDIGQGKLRAWRSGDWTVFQAAGGGVMTTISLTEHEVAVLCARCLFPTLASAIEEICDRYGEDPDATGDQSEVAAGIFVDVENLLAERSA